MDAAALPRLFDEEDVGGTGRWSFAIVTFERTWRVTLPAVAPRRDRGAVWTGASHSAPRRGHGDRLPARP